MDVIISLTRSENPWHNVKSDCCRNCVFRIIFKLINEAASRFYPKFPGNLKISCVSGKMEIYANWFRKRNISTNIFCFFFCLRITGINGKKYLTLMGQL